MLKRPRPGCSGCCPCSSRGATGAAANSRSGSASACGPCGATSTGCVTSVIRWRRRRARRAVTGSASGAALPRCCWTTRRRWPWRSACTRPRRQRDRAGGDRAAGADQAPADAAVPAPAPDRRLPRHDGPADRAGIPPDAVDPELLTAVAAACRDQRRLRLRYRGRRWRHQHPRRRAAPPGPHAAPLVPGGLGHRPRRLADLPPGPHPGAARARPGARFTPRQLPADDVAHAAYVAQSISSAPYRYRARILIHAPVADVARRISPGRGPAGSRRRSRCVLHAGIQFPGRARPVRRPQGLRLPGAGPARSSSRSCGRWRSAWAGPPAPDRRAPILGCPPRPTAHDGGSEPWPSSGRGPRGLRSRSGPPWRRLTCRPSAISWTPTCSGARPARRSRYAAAASRSWPGTGTGETRESGPGCPRSRCTATGCSWACGWPAAGRRPAPAAAPSDGRYSPSAAAGSPASPGSARGPTRSLTPGGPRFPAGRRDPRGGRRRGTGWPTTASRCACRLGRTPRCCRPTRPGTAAWTGRGFR